MQVVEHMFIATFNDRRKDSIIRNPWIAAKVIRAKRERVLGVFQMYGDVKVEIRKPRNSGDPSEECELNWVSGREDRVSPISLAVVWSEPSDGKSSHAMLLVSSARCKAALPRYHQRSTSEARRWENDWYNEYDSGQNIIGQNHRRKQRGQHQTLKKLDDRREGTALEVEFKWKCG